MHHFQGLTVVCRSHVKSQCYSGLQHKDSCIKNLLGDYHIIMPVQRYRPLDEYMIRERLCKLSEII